MNKIRCGLLIVLLLLAGALVNQASAQSPDPKENVRVSLILTDELKAKLASNTPLTIIDVRASEGYANSNEKIKGAIHVKLRRLHSRLSFPPLSDVPRTREVVTYCACPNEESSIEAAKILLTSGFKNVRALKGGWQEWLKANGQVESKARGL